VRIGSLDAAALDMLALGAEVEVIHPAELRARVGQLARRIAELHGDGAAPEEARRFPCLPAHDLPGPA
jgi:hypothetical protein